MTDKKSKKEDRMGPEVERELSFKLSKEEIHDRGLKMAALDGEMAELAAEKSKFDAEMKQKINERETQRLQISAVLRAKHEKRVVLCKEFKNLDANAMEYWFEDEKMDERALTFEERQLDFEATPPPQTRRGRKPKAAEDSEKPQETDVADVLKAETSRKTKRSAVDGIHHEAV